MDLLGILLGLGFLIWMSFRGWSVLVLTPLAALIVAIASGEPMLAHWTQTFMGAAGGFVAQFFPLFLIGAVFGKLMDDSGSVTEITRFMTEKLGIQRAILAVVLAGALVTYGGVSLFVAFFVIVPMAQGLFRAANIPYRLMPAAIGLGTFTFTMSAMPGTPAVQNAIPMPFFGTTPFAAPGLGIIASIVMFSFGMWWLLRAAAAARRAGEGYGREDQIEQVNTAVAELADNALTRERASTSDSFDPHEIHTGCHSTQAPSTLMAVLPLLVVIAVNFIMSMVILPRVDTSFLANAQWGGISLSSVSGVWSVIVALLSAITVLIIGNRKRLLNLRETVAAGANASSLPILSVASLVGFGAVVAAMPVFSLVTKWVLSIQGGPLVSLAVSTNILAALTGSASGGMTIALDALGASYLQLATEIGMDPALLHRVAVIGAGTLDSLPHNGAVVTLLTLCGSTHSKSYLDIVMSCIIGAVIALVVVIVLGTMFGSF
jgi:H+/gluconate symporter-like permease